MVFLKKHIFKIGLIFILLSAGFLCIHTVWNYSNNTAQNQSGVGFNNPSLSEKNKLADNQNQIPREQKPDRKLTQPVASANEHMRGRITSTSMNYNAQLITYSILFLVLFIEFYYMLVYKKVKIHSEHERILMLTLPGVGLLLRISMATFIEGHPFDVNIFKSWATTAANNLSQVYSNSRSSDYPPLYMYILFLIGKSVSIPAVSPYFTLLIKLPSILADIVTSLVIYKLARKYVSLEISMLVSAFYIFNPAVFINSTIWGQVDSFFTLIIICSIFMLSEKKIGLSSALFAAAVMMKPQGIIFLPVLFFELIRLKNLKSFLKTVIFALITTIIIILPFSLNQDVFWIFRLFSNTVSEYSYASVNGFNFFSLIGKNYTKDTATMFILSYHSWGMIFIVIITALSWFIYIKGNSRVFAFAAALLQIAGVFTFSVDMHERYLFPAAALSILSFIYLKDKRLLLLAAGFSCTIYINTYYVLYETLKGINSISFNPTLIFTSLLNVLLFIYLVKILLDIVIKKKTCVFR
ncbi:hypothetical protein CPJCM30710_04380 [Clostridium polyendosporum]|uniref:Mannosyltransferase related to Gpi18 n=1 Tax=Clostridium polyendosporum TaxID=69208 RepID=A0A919RWX1_9CLOT|nr:glycosyltransferase family 39 protein [Clostridium polyendosporum]GIM27772.1 hypothetical protein CPJCM30710_04380 [Clostridium polyendosporum]